VAQLGSLVVTSHAPCLIPIYRESCCVALSGGAGRIGVKKMAILSGRRYSWLFIIWVIVGIVIAWTHAYIKLFVLKIVLSALLAIFLWPLVLIGVNLHLH
jgi:hypothetical protein